MGIDIQQGKTKALRLVPEAPMTAPTCAITDRTGTVIGTATATPHPLSTTVASYADNTASYLKLTSTTGLAVGDTIRVADATFGLAASVVAEVTSPYVRLITPLPAIPDTGSVVVGLDVTLTIPAAATGTLAMDNVVSVYTATEEIVELFNVVAHVFRGPITALMVRDHIARLYAGEYAGATQGDDHWQFHAAVAAEINGNIRGRLLESGAFVSRYWDPTALTEAGRLMLRLVLADRGYWTGDGDREDQLRSLRIELKERVGGLLRGAAAYDEDNDGTITSSEVDGSTTIRGER